MSKLVLPLLALAALLLGLTGCHGPRITGNALVITDTTTGPNDFKLTVTSGTDVVVTGMQVDTVGGDTVVTRLHEGGARRFILKGLTGYRGRIRFESVDLVVGDTSVWIDGSVVKAYGSGWSIEQELTDDADNDVFGGRDLVLSADGIAPVGG